MIASYGYKSKKEIKASIGKKFNYTETSMMGEEFKPNGRNTYVGPSAYERKFYGTVTCENGIIVKAE